MPIVLIPHLVCVVPTTLSAATVLWLHITTVPLVHSGTIANALHPIYAIRILLFSFAAGPNILLVLGLTLSIPADTSQLAIGDLLALLSIVSGVNTTGHLPRLLSLLAPGSGSATAAGPIPASPAFLDPAALLITCATNAFAHAVGINGMAMQSTIVAHAFVHDGHDGEVVALDPSLGAEQGLFAVLVWFFHSVSLGDVNRGENAMQVDDPDHPMADDTAQDIVDSTDDNMIVDVKV